MPIDITKNLENVLKNYYLSAISDNIRENRLAKLIPEKSNHVWGNEIIYCDCENQIKKPLRTLYGSIELSEKAIRASQFHTSAIISLLGNELEEMCRNVGQKVESVLIDEIIKDCGLECADKEMREVLLMLPRDLIQENIEQQQLCDWQWLKDENGKILQQVNGKPLYQATIVKYGNFIIKEPLKEIIRRKINE